MLGLAVLASTVGIAVNLVRPDGIPLRTSQGEISGIGFLAGGTIGLEEAYRAFQAKGSIFIDARSPDVYRQGHIQGARNLPWAGVVQDLSALSNLPADTAIIVYDDGEAASAISLAGVLMSVGHKSARVLDGGWSGWNKAGFPIETIE